MVQGANASQVGASASVSGTIARAIAAAMRLRGHDPTPVLTRVGIDESLLTDVRSRVSAVATARLWEEVPRLIGEPDLGLGIGENPGDALGLAMYLLQSSPTLGEGLLKLGEYYRVFNDVHPLMMEPQPDQTLSLIVRTKNEPLPAPRHAVEFAFAWFMSTTRRITGRDLVPLTVRFEHPEPESVATHARIFRCPVRFDQDASELRFPMAWLEYPHPSYDPHLGQLLELEAKAELERLPANATCGARVREVLRPMLPGAYTRNEEPTLEIVASKLAMSARTLQRTLKDEGTTFQRELDGLRQRIAESRLRDGNASLVEIAHELGFADQSTFHKAFVRWTGRTPGEFRRG
jgi:AraC-like DNA-binding protein